MPITEYASTRTLTLVLPESDWHALRQLEPDTVNWLQAQIRARLASTRSERDANQWESTDDY